MLYTNFSKADDVYAMQYSPHEFNSYMTVRAGEVRSLISTHTQHARTMRGYIDKTLSSVKYGTNVSQSMRIFLGRDFDRLKMGEITSIYSEIAYDVRNNSVAISRAEETLKVVNDFINHNEKVLTAIGSDLTAKRYPQEIDVYFFEEFLSGRTKVGFANTKIYHNKLKLIKNPAMCNHCGSLVIDYDPKYHHIVSSSCAYDMATKQLKQDGLVKVTEAGISSEDILAMASRGLFEIKFVPSYTTDIAVPEWVISIHRAYHDLTNLDMSFAEYVDMVVSKNENKNG